MERVLGSLCEFYYLICANRELFWHLKAPGLNELCESTGQSATANRDWRFQSFKDPHIQCPSLVSVDWYRRNRGCLT